MIDYSDYQRIHYLHREKKLSVMQIAQDMQLDYRTVAKWLETSRYHAKQGSARSSVLDPYKDQLIQWLETHPYSAQQCFQRVCDLGYPGGYTTVKEYVRKVRPIRKPAFLTLAFAPGECAQVDWGSYNSIAVGDTRRRLSFFVMVLCHSRLMYVEFTVLQTMEHFLACHQHAFEYFGHRVPQSIMVDNLRSAVLKRPLGEAPLLNPQYQAFADHYGFTIKPCSVGKGNEKGRVENGVGYIKKNLLNGLTLGDFASLQPAARQWLDEIANQRIHGETRVRPIDRFREEEQPAMRPITTEPYDIGQLHQPRASNQFRVRFDGNRYSIPAEYASQIVTLKAYPDCICIYAQHQLIARHVRCYDRNKDNHDPDHSRELVQQRKRARDQQLYKRFLTLSPKAQDYYLALETKRFNAKHHVQKIVALSDIYGAEKVARAMEDAFVFQAFSCEYIANLLESRERLRPEASALYLTHHAEMLDLAVQPPDLSIYNPPCLDNLTGECHDPQHQNDNGLNSDPTATESSGENNEANSDK